MGIFTGTNRADVINGSSANDEIYGRGGSDILNGGGGNDTIGGASGNDTINGNTGDDILFGNTGNDNISGGAGADELFGGSGSDTVNGGDGEDQLYGGAGNDVLTGGNGVDEFFFGSNHGDDRISDFEIFGDLITLGTSDLLSISALTGSGSTFDQVLVTTTGGTITLDVGTIDSNIAGDIEIFVGQAIFDA